MNRYNKYLKRGLGINLNIEGEGVQRTTGDGGVQTTTGLGTTEKKEVNALSNDTDPRVKKLKKALENLTITPPKKYIKIF